MDGSARNGLISTGRKLVQMKLSSAGAEREPSVPPLLPPQFFAIYGAEREAELIAGFPFKARSTVIPTASRFTTDGKTYSAGRLFLEGAD